MRHFFLKSILKVCTLLCPGLFLSAELRADNSPTSFSNEKVWYDGTHPVTYHMTRSAVPVVQIALGMLNEDLRQVTGKEIRKEAPGSATLRIIQLDKEKISTRQLETWNVPVDELRNRKEAFFITVTDEGQIVIVGSDARGTAYGILEISRLAGVSPWVWWGDVTPKRKEKLVLSSDFKTLQSPSVEYRGIFLNDEDWTLQPWSWQRFSPSDRPGLISAKTYKEIFKLLLRLRANTIWPGMHGISTPFYFVPGAKETADSCGIVIGTSHCEPLMRNNVGEWDIAQRGNYNYITNRQAVLDYWEERLREVRGYENFYTVGMRGIHDGSMEGVKTLQEKTGALQQVLYDQRELLAKHIDSHVEQIPQVFVPYKEVLQIMENGLDVPEDITLMWCDDNYGYMTRLSDSLQQQRSGGAGVYYHLSYWGRPHDYMWLCTTQPGLIYNEMKQAYDHQARKLWIVNVHDMKPAAYDLELFLDLAWNIDAVSSSSIYRHLETWLCRDFGETAGRQLLPVMQEFYRLSAIRKPEFMGWSQVELDKKKYPKGWSPVADTEFSFTEFGNETARYLGAYKSLTHALDRIRPLVPADRQDAYFAQIEYPIKGAAAMAEKMLEAQKARTIAAGNYNEARWTRQKALYRACAKSQTAYQEIRRLTAYYNDSLANGKWRGSMCDHPRDLYVFHAPSLPVALSEAEIRECLPETKPSKNLPETIPTEDCIAGNACNYVSASPGTETVQALGHSMNAVSLPQGGSVIYSFNCSKTGEAVLRTAVIPTQPNDRGDIRFSVRIDSEEPQIVSFKEPFRSERWKQNVLRGQAVCETRHHLTSGTHTLTITALDPHVVIDQWMIDFQPARKFYMFPLKASY